MSVLIVEDNANILEMLKTLLERHGYLVDLVRTEAQNSRLVQELDPSGSGPTRFPGPKPVSLPLPPLPPDEGGEP